MVTVTAHVVVDAANVVGSRIPALGEAWWRDRAGAASRLLAWVAPLVGRDVELRWPDAAAPASASTGRVVSVVVVLEGRARDAVPPTDLPAAVRVVRAAGSGDDEIVAQATALAGTGIAEAGTVVVVVTADRGLRARLPAGTVAVGPSWLRALLGS